MTILIKGGHVINPATQMDEVADVLIKDQKIKKDWKRTSGKRSRTCDQCGRMLCDAGIY